MAEDESDQIVWRRMVAAMWAKAGRNDPQTAVQAEPVPADAAMTNRVTPAVAETITATIFHSQQSFGTKVLVQPAAKTTIGVAAPPGLAVAGRHQAIHVTDGSGSTLGSDTDWRKLVEAHWNSLVGCATDTASLAKVLPVPFQGGTTPFIEIEDEEDDDGDAGVEIAEIVGCQRVEAEACRAAPPNEEDDNTMPPKAVSNPTDVLWVDDESNADVESNLALDDLTNEVAGSESAVASQMRAEAPVVMMEPEEQVHIAEAPVLNVPAPELGVTVQNESAMQAGEVLGHTAPISKEGGAAANLKQYLVDNSLLQAKTHGLGYRFSKHLQNIDKTSTAAWGSTVLGSDEGDGWLRVGSKFLPMEASGKRVLTPKVVLVRTTSGTLYAPPSPAARAVRPAAVFIPRSENAGGGCEGGSATALRRQGSFAVTAPAPAGLFVPRSLALGAAPPKRAASPESGGGGGGKRPKSCEEGLLAGTDTEGRRYDMRNVVVNFANVGATYACKVLGRDKQRGERLFDWEGVRRCVRHLKEELGLEVIGVVMENFWAPDNSKDYKIGIPEGIKQMCDSIEETPKLPGRNHKSADDEMTIKCAYRRNCRFLDNDNYRDWINEMRNDWCRTWLENCQEMLQMRYFFDAQLGTFDTLDGTVPAGLLSPVKPP